MKSISSLADQVNVYAANAEHALAHGKKLSSIAHWANKAQVVYDEIKTRAVKSEDTKLVEFAKRRVDFAQELTNLSPVSV